MRTIQARSITQAVAELCIRANLVLRLDVLLALKKAYARETKKQAKDVLKAIVENASVARKKKLAICQDTGMPVVFAELGQDARIKGDLYSAIQRGVALGYRKGSLRSSIVPDPLGRGSSRHTPAVIHIALAKGSKLKIVVLPKGFGSENKSVLKMLKPTAGIAAIEKCIIDAVINAGCDACPPYVVGVGIGGTADYAALLAKKALLRKLGTSRPKLQSFEKKLLRKINALNIGPMGLGGKTTALAVNIETYPTHIAGLPVAVNISCHALRSASAVI